MIMSRLLTRGPLGLGAPAMADAGQLVCVLAGPSQAVERVKPYCKGVMGKAIIDFSDQPVGKVRPPVCPSLLENFARCWPVKPTNVKEGLEMNLN